MDVHLLVYDLSRGLARQMSAGLLGFQLDAIYHTSIELKGREYVYDGNVVAIRPGSSHLGRPMQRLHLGKTERAYSVIALLDIFREVADHAVFSTHGRDRGVLRLVARDLHGRSKLRLAVVSST